MQAVRNVLSFQQQQVVLHLVHDVVGEAVGLRQVETEILGEAQPDHLLANLLADGLRQLGALVQTGVVVVDPLAQLGELRIESALLERRHHVIDERRHPSPPRDETFADDVDVVDVEMRQIGDQRIGRIVRRQAHVLAVEPFERAVRADMHDRVGLEAFAQPRIGGDVLVMRREVLGVVHLLGVLAPSARRLRQQRDLAELHRRDDQAAAGRHQSRSSRVAPVLEDSWP